MDTQDMNESAGGRVIGNYYEYDGDGRLICHWQTVEIGGLCMSGTAQRLDAAPILVESRPTGSPPCPGCRGTGRVMLLIRSKPCETCGGTGKGIVKSLKGRLRRAVSGIVSRGKVKKVGRLNQSTPAEACRRLFFVRAACRSGSCGWRTGENGGRGEINSYLFIAHAAVLRKKNFISAGFRLRTSRPLL